MRRIAAATIAGSLTVVAGAAVLVARRQPHIPSPQRAGYSGSAPCRECHESFYRLWSTSHHGLAMQPFTAALAREQFIPQPQDIIVGDHRYRADLGAGQVRESTTTGDVGLPIAHLVGGKNVYYLLTPRERGRLQVLPVAFDLRRREWYDVAASGLRHFADVSETAVHWTFPELTFNASCRGCHVSQLSSHYDAATDSYRTTWAEPGINCETCHGPGQEHIRVTRAAGPGQVPTDLKLITPRTFSHEQKNEMCAPCHARTAPISDGFRAGERTFDAFDLVGIENRDFFPDGRDLGENYTFTAWRMSPCAKSGQLDCLHCHTSSGRYRFGERARANQACLPCHEPKVREAVEHSHHPEAKVVCIDCHMPKTEFARMLRSDHSMRPPAPAASLAFRSPNACNLCHQDKDDAWSDHAVRKWHARDYQVTVLRRGSLVAAARKADWSALPAMLAAVQGIERDEVTAVALLRLLHSCSSAEKGPAVLAALRDPSPWVRAAAAEAAGEPPGPEMVPALLAATRDPVRLPRVRAAAALSSLRGDVAADRLADLEAATRELEAALAAHPDDFAAQLDLGRLHASRGDTVRAIAAYRIAAKLRPDSPAPLVNLSLLYNALGRNADAEAVLRAALALDPKSAAAHLNLGMLLGELERFPEAEAELHAAIREDPGSAPAAYNLAVVLARDRPEQAVTWSRRASELAPDSAKYAYTWAFYLARRGDEREAVAVLRHAVDRKVASAEIQALLGELLARAGQKRALFPHAAAESLR